ncbi:MAG: gluconate 2-dehydrogenase subunit 3 family protein [Gammaproteobacteria bacterium]|nr:gluconate 2-dehydrogenase subunit 3 family protein [Gammaproteobacteria bacterium]
MNNTINAYLQAWDESLADARYPSLNHLESRRHFLKQVLCFSAASIFSQQVLANTLKLNTTTWKTLAAVHLHMFPVATNEPDAASINATAFLKSVLEWPGVEMQDKKFIVDGVGWLNGLATKQFQKEFVLLAAGQKETVLRTVEKSKAGESWLALILLYLLEALLSDPVYGGNVNAVGWKWLQHQPGFPRPPLSKRYFKL